MWLWIEPLDVWMFRDGKPFSAGSNHSARSLFPPPAFSVQGGLRTLYLDRVGNWGAFTQNCQSEVGYGDDLGSFRMHGPYLAKWNAEQKVERLYPLPADITAPKAGGLRCLTYLEDTERDTVLNTANSDIADFVMLNIGLDDEDSEGRYWLPESVFCGSYLAGQGILVDACVRQADLFDYEYRYGTALNYDRRSVRSDDGMLYAADFVRLQSGVGILVELPEPTPFTALFTVDGSVEFCRFGGEGRSARIMRLARSQLSFTPPPTVAPDMPGKIVFVTPTYFERGYLPGDKRGSQFEQQCFSAALRRPLHLGSWDLIHKRPRAIHRYVPAGSVYYLRQLADLTSPLCDQPTDAPNLEALGFGEFFSGIRSDIDT